MTLLFGFAQAAACAEAKVTLISPLLAGSSIGTRRTPAAIAIQAPKIPVVSVTKIFNYFKKHGYTTEVMGASFRNIDEIIELAGCDLLTISPNCSINCASKGAPWCASSTAATPAASWTS